MSNSSKLPKSHVRKIKNHAKQQNKSAQRQEIQKANKKAKRGAKEKRVRHKSWTPANLDLANLNDPDLWDEFEGWEDHGLVERERMVPVGEQERKRELERTLFQTKPAEEVHDSESMDFGGRNDDPLLSETVEGRVIEVSSGLCRVEVAGQTLLCTVRQALKEHETGFTNIVAVGDIVRVLEQDEETGVVEQVLPRRTILARPDVFHSHLHQVLVANADQLLIVASWREPTIWFELIDRYLIAAERSNLPAVICVNKVDLAEDRQACEAALQPYRTLGIETVMTSAESGEGIVHLRAIVQGKVSVLTGLSGVGKSSLLSEAEPGLNLRVGAVGGRKEGRREEGRHTTTQSNWFALAAGGAVIDTPGIREFGLAGLYKDELAAYFPEIAEVATRCRFRNCTHINEAECGVLAAVQQGEIAESRYHSYERIYPTLA